VSVSSTHNPGDVFPVGNTTVTYTFTDAANNQSQTSFTVTVVDNTAPVIAGTPSTVTVNTGVGRTTCDQVATWTAPTASDNCAGTVSVSSTHNPGDVFPVGNTTVTYTFTDAANNQSQTSFTVTVVDNTAPVIAGTPSTVTVNTGVGRTTCDQVATWTAPTASDNCAGTVGVSSSHNPGDVFSVGSTIVTYTFTDANNNQSQTSFTVTVVDNTAPVLNDPANVTGINDAGFCYKVVVLSAPSATDNCGISVAGVTASGIPADNKFPVGTTTVIWSVTDIHGHTSTQTQDVTITNAAPVVSVTGPTSPQQINSLVTITIFHGDNNVTSATINWDDNSPLESVAPGNPSFTSTHKYITPGVYTVTVTVTDACGATSTSAYKYVVIFDPNGGFVTGGGWFISPECAYKPATGVTGKAHFGFVAKYKKGSTTPDGNTEFQFQAGDINFNSSSYDDMRLVIAGYKANYTGNGKINGMGNYGFLVSGIDGQITGGGGTDKFRIRIWDINDGNRVIYDNNCTNTDENADPATAIEGGSIVIHDPKKKTSNRMEAPAFVLAPQDFNVKVLGNPSLTTFRLQLQSNNMQEKFTVKVVDVNGRLIEVQQNLYAGQVIELGSKYTQGTYFAEVMQGTNRKVVKLVKISRD
jgi:hypothetical protein